MSDLLKSCPIDLLAGPLENTIPLFFHCCNRDAVIAYQWPLYCCLLSGHRLEIGVYVTIQLLTYGLRHCLLNWAKLIGHWTDSLKVQYLKLSERFGSFTFEAYRSILKVSLLEAIVLQANYSSLRHLLFAETNYALFENSEFC
jgi:hypothetical protein